MKRRLFGERSDPTFLSVLARGAAYFQDRLIAKIGPVVPEPAERRRLLDDAEALRLDLLAAAGLERVGAPRAELDLERRKAAALARSLSLHHLRQKLSRRLDEKGVPHLFLKGALADALFWKGTGARGTTDLDVLVPKADLAGAREVLAGLGLSPVRRPGHLATDDAKPERRYPPQDPRRGFEVDLHTGVARAPPYRDPAAELLSRRRVYETPLGKIPGPCPDDLLVHAAVNLASAKFASGRTKLLLDVACGLTSLDVELGRAADDAQRAGAGWALWAILLAAETVFVLPPLDEAVLGSLRPPTLSRAVAARIAGLGGEQALPDTPLGRLLAEAVVLGRPSWLARGALRWARLRAKDVLAARRSDQGVGRSPSSPHHAATSSSMASKGSARMTSPGS